MKDRQQVEPIPEQFDSYEAAAEFWDSHDTTDYLEDFETVLVEEAQLKRRHFDVEIDSDLIATLSEQAKQQGVGISQLVNQMLRETLSYVS
jgi:predicted HicB family RNase H-like nuclease